MRRIVLSLLTGLAVVFAARAQYPVSVAQQAMGPQYNPDVPPTGEGDPFVGPRWTVNAEYLLWFLKPIHFQTPLIGTTPDPNQDLMGSVTAIGVNDPAFVNYFGPGDRNRGPLSGVRLSVTTALSVRYDREVYTELAGLWLPFQSVRRTLRSNPDGNPAVLLPFRNPEDGLGVGEAGEYSTVIAGNIGDNRVEGLASVYTGTQMWGGEWNVCGPLFDSPNLGLEAIVGARYLGINDLVELSAHTNLSGGVSWADKFSTTNHFVGGQLGFRLLCAGDRWMIMSANKLALGNTNANLSVQGTTSRPGGSSADEGRGGLYTAESNIGDVSTNRFAMVIDLNLGVRYAVAPAVGLSVGYNYLYWNNLLRAGDQITRTINPVSSPALNPFAIPMTPNDPQVTKDFTGIWAHGVNIGVDFRY